MYVSTSNIPAKHRSALVKFRCGVAPIRLETERYEICLLMLDCHIRKNAVETENHVLLECSTYETIRRSLYEEAVNHNFHGWNDDYKFEFVLSYKRKCQSLFLNIKYEIEPSVPLVFIIDSYFKLYRYICLVF
jgi:hypothetical protein